MDWSLPLHCGLFVVVLRQYCSSILLCESKILFSWPQIPIHDNDTAWLWSTTPQSWTDKTYFQERLRRFEQERLRRFEPRLSVIVKLKAHLRHVDYEKILVAVLA